MKIRQAYKDGLTDRTKAMIKERDRIRKEIKRPPNEKKVLHLFGAFNIHYKSCISLRIFEIKLIELNWIELANDKNSPYITQILNKERYF